MAQLLSLPSEVLHEIISRVNDLWSPATELKALCLTCKRLRDVAEPVLYRQLCTSKHDREQATIFLRFARTIAQRPELRNDVRVVDMYLERNYDFDGCTQVLMPPDFDLSSLRAAAPAYFDGPADQGWAPGKTIKVFPHVMAMLSLLPNLSVLRIRAKEPNGQREMYRLAELAENLPNLRELLICDSKRYNNTQAEFAYAPLVQLPRLRVLSLKHLDMANMFAEGAPRLRFPRASLGVERLSVRQCSMTNECMRDLIVACRRLTHFTYHQWSDINQREERLDVAVWHGALATHKDSLEEADLNCINEFDILDGWDNSPLEPWPSFRDFAKLTSLKMEYRRMRYDLLPQVLRELYLHDCRDIENRAEISGWCSVKKNWCPDLHSFQIMTTQHCRASQRAVKRYGFRWYCWSEMTRVYKKVDFLLKIWFRDFIDGTYHFSQVGSRSSFSFHHLLFYTWSHCYLILLSPLCIRPFPVSPLFPPFFCTETRLYRTTVYW